MQKHFELLRDLSTCMNSVNVPPNDNADEFQRKTDAVSQFLAEKTSEIGLTISDVISVELSVIRNADSLQRLGQQYPTFELQPFLISTLEDKIIPTVDCRNNGIPFVEEDLSVLGIILFALYQQRCNNPPDARFENAIDPQQLDDDLIPFSTQFLDNEITVGVLFSSPLSQENKRNGEDSTSLVDDDEDDNQTPLVVEEQEDKSPKAKNKRGRKSKTSTTLNSDDKYTSK